ncbi:CDP-glycerol glycerophosphotransferase family protein [Kangiella sediminilitoris]|uniref:CDP-glycerol:poly(Glycerophosphate)glycerophosphotransferase n=1 Tax=Kangiella sediminilitoris TaxID=1144748 RepID=A0A1B3BDS5_9GAMM|nr:CDP-glycerol glycerophosphotransferase family protein [Kangiella sediminilitoris]AOE50950.1 CDP-glycerol:poly(Glycerophosphate)glycerophosphotransferase [Kangiella sediminilitoris]
MKIFFDVAYLYYLPHFEPVINALLDNPESSITVVFSSEPPSEISDSLHSKNVTTEVVDSEQRLDYYRKHNPDWVIFGHATEIAEELNQFCKTALILHGLGPKSTYYNASGGDILYRFVESESRQQKLQSLYPDKHFILTGYTKLDPIINDPSIAMDLAALGLDPKKPTLLYSPTFYPSTIENFPKDWPAEFSDYNILLKPHYLSLIKSAYKNQRALIKHWETFDNVYLAKESEQNLVPFMATADLMISETSSALFEFIALDKPVVICHFLKLRWGYRGLLKFRLNKRLSDDYQLFQSMGANIDHYRELKSAVESNLQDHSLYKQARQEITQQVVGTIDGQSSQRVAQFILNQD